ncbi:MAG: hypothetical protein ACD_38C00064G0004 [uncultured bacterium]|nr:MAG: hypothetical protein ACD_38C00064G0004 [uncultured bacterium]
MKIKKFLMNTILKDFVILWSSPIDEPAIKSIKEESAKVGFEKDFLSYVFGNIILGEKS